MENITCLLECPVMPAASSLQFEPDFRAVILHDREPLELQSIDPLVLPLYPPNFPVATVLPWQESPSPALPALHSHTPRGCEPHTLKVRLVLLSIPAAIGPLDFLENRFLWLVAGFESAICQ